MARTVVAIPLHNGERHLAEALETLLSQTDDDLALVLLDDASTDSTPEIARRYAAQDDRIAFERLERRQGLIAAWNAVRALALERHPDAEYFAWGSDHDAWHPRWLELVRAELDAHPEAVLAYPLSVRIDDDGELPRTAPPWRFETTGVAEPRERLARFTRDAASGDMIYGLFRRAAIADAPFRPVLSPDRLLLAEMSWRGEFRQVPELLWYRRFVKNVTARSQRAALFAGPSPASARAPWPLAHARVLRRALPATPHEAREASREYAQTSSRVMVRHGVAGVLGTAMRALPHPVRRAVRLRWATLRS